MDRQTTHHLVLLPHLDHYNKKHLVPLIIQRNKNFRKGIYLIHEMVLKFALCNRKGEKDVYESLDSHPILDIYSLYYIVSPLCST